MVAPWRTCVRSRRGCLNRVLRWRCWGEAAARSSPRWQVSGAGVLLFRAACLDEHRGLPCCVERWRHLDVASPRYSGGSPAIADTVARLFRNSLGPDRVRPDYLEREQASDAPAPTLFH